jgi:hypothetical protein
LEDVLLWQLGSNLLADRTSLYIGFDYTVRDLGSGVQVVQVVPRLPDRAVFSIAGVGLAEALLYSYRSRDEWLSG